jgi:hypothetical protein
VGIRGVVQREVDDDPHVALVRLGDQLLELVEGAELGQDRLVVGDVISTVAQRRGEERREPERVDAQPLQVVESRDEAAEVAGAVTIAVDERADHHLVEDGSAVPLGSRVSPGNWMGAVKLTGLLSEQGENRM